MCVQPFESSQESPEQTLFRYQSTTRSGRQVPGVRRSDCPECDYRTACAIQSSASDLCWMSVIQLSQSTVCLHRLPEYRTFARMQKQAKCRKARPTW